MHPQFSGSRRLIMLIAVLGALASVGEVSAAEVVHPGDALTASLTVRFEVSPLHPVSLIPVDVELPAGLSRQRAIRLWTRQVEGLEERWTSLPVGTYQIMLLPARRPPVEIGEVVLAPGADESVRVGDSERREASEHRIDIRTAPEVSTIAEALSITEWRDGVPKQVQAKERAGVLSIVTECGAGSIVVVSSETLIGSSILDGRCTDPITIRLAERSTVLARLRVPPDAVTPGHAVLRAAQCRNGAAIEIPTAVRNGRIQAGVPAQCRVLSLHTADFAPVRIASQPLQPGASQDLGSISLQPGAVAVLRIRSGRTGEPLQGVSVTAVRTIDAAAMRGELAHESIAVGTAVTDVDGWTRVTVPAAERLAFFLQAPGRRLPQISDDYEFAAGEELYVDDLRVDPAASVLVTLVVPPSLEGVEWQQIELEAADRNRWPARVPIRANVSPTGTVVEDVPPGTYRIFAAGRLRNGFAVRLGERKLDIAPGIDQSVTLDVTGAVYSGKLTRRGIAVQGTINLTPAEPHRQSAVARTNAAGEFQVLLTGAGKYRVHVQTVGKQWIALGREIELTDSNDDVTIEIPAGEIRGRVVDRAGRGIPGIFASALRQGLPRAEVSAATTEDGSFVLAGITEGTWSVHAASATARSPESIVTVADDADEVTLVAEPLQTVTIRVVDPAGVPVRGVEVEFDLPRPGRPDDAPLRSGMTRASGEVRFPLLEAEQRVPVNIILTGPDRRLSCAVRTLNADQTITLPAQIGEARLVWSRTSKRLNSGGRPWLVGASGCAVPFYARAEHEPSGEPAMVFSRLAAGQWTFVRSHSVVEHAAVLMGRALSLPAITTFRVEPGTTTRVSFD